MLIATSLPISPIIRLLLSAVRAVAGDRKKQKFCLELLPEEFALNFAVALVPGRV